MALVPERGLSPAAKTYITATAAAAAGVLWWLSQRDLVLGPMDAFAILAVLAIFVESLPMTFSFKGQLFQYSLSPPFILSLMTVFGLAPAAMVQVVASLTSDMLRRKPWSKAVFNTSQSLLALVAAGVLLEVLLGERITYPGMTFAPAQLGILLLAFVVFFLVNNALVAIVVQLVTGWRHLDVIKRFLSRDTLIDGTGLLLVPVLAVSVQRNPLLALLLMVPIAALYRATILAMENMNLLNEREKALEEKEAAERRFESLVQSSSDMICLTDSAGQVSYTSPSVERIAGYSVEATPWLLFDRIDQDDHAIVSDGLARASASTVPVTLPETRLLHADGTVRWVEVIVSNLSPQEPERGMVLNIRDTSERRALEAQLLQSQKLDAVGRLAGGIAHDFNNLLSVVQGFARFARDAGPEGPSYRDDLDEVLKTCERGTSLVRQLLLFSRSELNEPQIVDVNEVITGLSGLLKVTVTEGVDLIFDLADPLPAVEIDPGELEQVLINLAVNARDAMDQTGVLTITTAVVHGDDPAIAGDWVRLRVADSGTGMDKATIDRIFEPFFTTKERGSGTGLGLATVHGIVTSAGGRLGVDSTLGGGTTFVVDLPATTGRPRPKEHEPSPIEPAESHTVLVVEDDPALCAVVRRILAGAGYEVIATESPGAALDLISSSSGEVSLLLTDVVMPGMTGRELADKVLAESPRTKLLFMSGYTDDLIGSRGADELLRKPFTPEVLLASVRRTLATDRS